MRHLERMDRAEIIFVFNQDGYLGNSVVMEIGYAYAQRKPIYTLAPIQDQFLRCLITAVVSLEELLCLTSDVRLQTRHEESHAQDDARICPRGLGA